MRRVKIPSVIYGFLAALLASGSFAASEPVITLAADEWCPYNCSPDDKEKPGYMVEIAQAVFAKHGYRVEYKTMPFQRAMQEVLKGTLDGVVAADAGTAKEAEEMFQRTYGKPAKFARSEPMAVTQVSFYTASATQWTFDPAHPEDSVRQLGGKVGIPQGYAYDISQLLKKNDLQVEIAGEAPMEQLLKMLDSGRIKAIVDDDAVINFVATKIGAVPRIRYAGAAGEPLQCFIGFNAVAQDKATWLDEGVKELRANGELARILQKYNVKDWKR